MCDEPHAQRHHPRPQQGGRGDEADGHALVAELEEVQRQEQAGTLLKPLSGRWRRAFCWWAKPG
jgi:hypothetical protein